MNAGILLAFYLLLITSTVIAQEDTTVQSLSEVVVSATRTQQQEIQLPYVTNTIKRKELNRFQPRTTPESIKRNDGCVCAKNKSWRRFSIYSWVNR